VRPQQREGGDAARKTATLLGQALTFEEQDLQQERGEVDDGLRAFMGELKAKRDVYFSEIDRISLALLK
jgi:hypothetical protein